MKQNLHAKSASFIAPGNRLRPSGWLFVILLVFSMISLKASAQDPGKQSGFFMSGPDKLYYEISGSGPALLIPSGGSGMDLRQWDAVVPALSKTHMIIAFDPRGIGKSDNPTAKYSDASDMNMLLNHLGLDRIGLLGLSSSGNLVLEFASRFPEKIVALVAASPFLPSFKFSDDMNERLNQFNQAANEGKEPFLNRMLDDPHFFPAPLDRSVRVFARENMGYNFDKGADFNPAMVIPLEQPLIDRLSAITAPTLLLVGELDHPEVHRRNKFILTQIPSSSEAVIRNAGHNSQLENPAGFLAAITPFLMEIYR